MHRPNYALWAIHELRKSMQINNSSPRYKLIINGTYQSYPLIKNGQQVIARYKASIKRRGMKKGLLVCSYGIKGDEFSFEQEF